MAGTFGALALLANPAGVAASRLIAGVPLLRALYVSVPVAAVLALIAVSASRRARFARARSVYAEAGRGRRLGRMLVWAGVFAALAGAVTLGVYAVLRSAGGG